MICKLTPGSQLGSYEIIAPLGAGGMGEVYRAKDSRLGREVALKVLPAEVASNPDRLSRFEREARIVAGLNHPNIVTLFSVDNSEGIHFLTMELVDGQTLNEIMALGGLSVDKIFDLMIPLGDALASAHEKGVVHRDLKPGNVMVTRDHRVKVLDFGLAKFNEVNANSERTQTAVAAPLISAVGQIVGTVPYMSPEQIRGEIVDERSDLFSMGVIMYELAAGHRPFTGDSHADIISAILRDSPVPLSTIRTDIPSDFERVVNRCLEKNPRERIQTALDVSNELRRARKLMDSGISVKPPSDAIASIAVLPFANRSANPDDEYFSDGLADELLNVLSRITGLRVSARSSSFRFRDSNEELAVIGEKLNVSAIVEGSVRKAGDRVRISVQLVKVPDGYQLWSESYDRTLDDIFAVQDDIARSVVKEIRATLLGETADSNASVAVKAEVAHAVVGRTSNPEAQRLYLLARHLFSRNTPEDTDTGIAYLKQALEQDRGFASARAALAQAYFIQADLGWVKPAEGAARAREAVDRALVLDPDLIEGYVQKGMIQLFFDWDWRGAAASFHKAKELAPNDLSVLGGLASLARSRGEVDEAIELYNKILETNPLSAGAYHALGYLFHATGDFARAEQAHRRALELAPGRSVLHSYLALETAVLGRGEEALREAANEPQESYRLWGLAIVAHILGDDKSSDETLDQLIHKYRETMSYQVAEICAARGDKDAAFHWLDKAFEYHDSGLSFVMASYYFRSLRDDPRWFAFVKKMNLVE